MNKLDLKKNSSDNDISTMLYLMSDKMGVSIDESMLTPNDKKGIMDLSRIRSKIHEQRSKLDGMRKKTNFFIAIFFICCLAFLETMFYFNAVTLLSSLIIGVISFVLIEIERKKQSQIKTQIIGLEEEIERKMSELVTNILQTKH